MVASTLTDAAALGEPEFRSDQDAKSFELRLAEHERKLSILLDEVACLERYFNRSRASNHRSQSLPSSTVPIRAKSAAKSVAPFPEACTKVRDEHLDRRAVKIPAVMARRQDSASRTPRSASSVTPRSVVGKSPRRSPLSDAESRDQHVRAIQDKYGFSTRAARSTDLVAPDVPVSPTVISDSSEALAMVQPVSEVGARDQHMSRKCERFPSLKAKSAAAVASMPAPVAGPTEKPVAQSGLASPRRHSRSEDGDSVDARDRILDRMRVRRGLA